MKNRKKIPFQIYWIFCTKKKYLLIGFYIIKIPGSLIDTTDKYWIKYYPSVSVSAGGCLWKWRKFWIIRITNIFCKYVRWKRKFKNIDAINVVGDSMDQH